MAKPPFGCVFLMSSAALLHAQQLQDDFSGSSIDPARWNVVTAGIPGSPSVSIQAGECRLTNRGYLVSVATFDPAALGGIRVSGTFRWANTYDQFHVLTRCDGVPTGQYGEAANGIQLHAGWETPPHFTLTAYGQRLTLGSVTRTGSAGFAPQAGVQYRFQLTDLGSSVTGRIDGPNNQWVELSCAVFADATTTKKIAIYNREHVFQNDCFIDDIAVESHAAMTSTYVLLPNATTWTQADAQAQAMGGHLVVIDDQRENDWLRDHVLPPNSAAWIGARKVNGVWGWVDGSPFTYTNWDANQPDNANLNQDRARIWSLTTNAGAWDDTDDYAPNVLAIVELPRARWEAIGSGCAGSNGTPRFYAQSMPQLGTTLQLQFANLPLQPSPMIAFAGFALQTTSLGFLGMPGCDAQIVPAISSGLAHAGGVAAWPVPVPAAPAFAGLHVYLQAVVAESAPGSALPAMVTNAIEVVLGF